MANALRGPGYLAPERDDQRTHSPITSKATPAARCNQLAGTARPTASPTSTAIADVATSADADPRNTAHRDRPVVAKASVASCVLSPSSAKNTAPNVVKTT